MPTIRAATLSDATRLAALAERTFRDTFSKANTPENMELHCAECYGERQQSAELIDTAFTTVVAEHDGVMVAFVQLNLAISADGAPETEIRRLYVDAPWHGAGLAQQLMHESIALADQHNARRLWLGVWEHNPRAIAFYRKCGFVECGEHVFTVGADAQRDVLMSLALPATRPQLR